MIDSSASSTFSSNYSWNRKCPIHDGSRRENTDSDLPYSGRHSLCYSADIPDSANTQSCSVFWWMEQTPPHREVMNLKFRSSHMNGAALGANTISTKAGSVFFSVRSLLDLSLKYLPWRLVTQDVAWPTKKLSDRDSVLGHEWHCMLGQPFWG